MTAFLLTWDGSDEGYDPRNYVADQKRTRRGKPVRANWNFGPRRSGIAVGDRVFLLRQHTDRGIVASGRLVDGRIYDDEHWADPTQTSSYGHVEWDTVLDTAERLPLETLLAEVEGHTWNQVRSSGQMLHPDAEQHLEQRWARHLYDLGRGPTPTTASHPASQASSAPTATAPVLCIWSSSSTPTSVENFEVGLATQTWGLKAPPKPTDRLPRWVLFGHRHTNLGPRQPLAAWQQGELDIVLCEFTTPYFTATAPHWPDETKSGTVIYPHRFGITPLARGHVTADPAGPLGLAGTDALRLAGANNHPVQVDLDIQPLLTTLGIALPSGTDRPDLSRTAGSPTAPSSDNSRGGRGRAGRPRSVDPAFNSAVEKHAVRLAIEHMRDKGWPTITELGKPFDLVCIKPDGTEKHVEVKGTTGAGADVAYTPNEVHHFRTCPHGADLIVVRDITVDATTTPYTTTGGELLHIPNYTAPPDHLQATGWIGQVIGWPTSPA